MNGFREDFPVRNRITSQFISHNLPWLTLVTLLQSLEEALGSSTVSSGLEIDIYNFPVLINRAPEVVLFSIDFGVLAIILKDLPFFSRKFGAITCRNHFGEHSTSRCDPRWRSGIVDLDNGVQL